MKKISFAGAYGIRSQGDDAALVVMAEALRRRLGSFDGVVITRHAQGNPYAPYGLRSVQNIEYEGKADSIGRWFRGFNYDDDRSDLDVLQNEIASSDLLILGAGNFLVDVTIDLLRGPIPYLTILTLMAKMAETPVMWFGISVGPFRTSYGRSLSRLAASLANVITVRDEQSVDELRQIGYHGRIIQLPDPVLGLRKPDANIAEHIASWREAHSKSGPVFAISIRDMLPNGIITTQQFVSGMANICDSLISRFNAVTLLIPHCTYQHGGPEEDDRNIAHWVVERMHYHDGAVVVTEDLTVEECLSLYSQAEIALCARVHANMYAAIQGVPPVAISYLPKVAAFMHWLGCEDLVVSLQGFSPEIVLGTVEAAMADRNRISGAILTRVDAGRAEVERYADIACNVIARRSRKA